MIQQRTMLRTAAIGMFLYAVYAVVAGIADLLFFDTLEWWANVWGILSGATLALAAVFVRISLPGGLALAIAGLLGLQSISLHNDGHYYNQLLHWTQAVRAGLSVLLIALAWYGWEPIPGGKLPEEQ